MYILDYATSNSILGTIRKLFARRDAWTLFYGIWTYSVKVVDFSVIFECFVQFFTMSLLLWAYALTPKGF